METRELIWLELMKWHGLQEVPGSLSNPTIISWFKEFGYDWVEDDSETAWCSLTINKVAKDCGLEYTGKLDARSWMTIGKGVTDPKIGHLVVFWREKKAGWKGHVGLFAGWSKDKKHILTLGGNQNNMIGIRAYPIAAFDFGLLGYRDLNYK
jgi:uncharacterized protein (TIGR02594 family)